MKFTLLRFRARQTICTIAQVSVTAAVLLVSLVACNLSQQSATSGTQGANSPQAAASQNAARPTIPSNLVAVLLVKKNNLNNEFRGEIYPIALLLNEHYLEASNDVTQNVRIDSAPDRILQVNEHRIITNAIKTFTVVSNQQKLGEFQVSKPVVSQFSCSSLITGQGNLQGDASLQTVFEQIPPGQFERFSGTRDNEPFDETLRMAIALSQPPATAYQPPTVSEADLARYRQSALKFGQDAIRKMAQERSVSVPGEAVVESLEVVDLNHDGSPEVFSQIKQTNALNANNSRQPSPTGFAAVWFTEKDGQPQPLETTQAAVSLLGSRQSPYDLLGTIDIDGNGIDELIVKRTGYESTSFEIYQYQNNQLKQVFRGAGYGC